MRVGCVFACVVELLEARARASAVLLQEAHCRRTVRALHAHHAPGVVFGVRFVQRISY